MSNTGDIWHTLSWKGAHTASPGAGGAGSRARWGDSPSEPDATSSATSIPLQSLAGGCTGAAAASTDPSALTQRGLTGAPVNHPQVMGALIPLRVNSLRAICTQINRVHHGQDWWLWGHCGPSFSRGARNIWLSGFITGLKMDFCPGGFFWTSSRLQRV